MGSIPGIKARKHRRDIFLQQRLRLTRRPFGMAGFGHGGFCPDLPHCAHGRKQPRKAQGSKDRRTDQHIAPAPIHHGHSGAIDRRRHTSPEGIAGLGPDSFATIQTKSEFGGQRLSVITFIADTYLNQSASFALRTSRSRLMKPSA